MTEQLAITLAAASVGFAAAIFFCIGNALNSAKRITSQATPRWDFSEPLARALTAQRAQYAVGALLLVASFLLQVWAALASATSPVNLPQWLHAWPYFVLAILLPTGLVAGWLSALLYKATMQKVLRLHKGRKEQLAKERESK